MNIYVGNLPKGTKNRELEKLFAEYGKVVSAAIARDKKSGTSRGFAFVEMVTRHEGEEAIAALNEKEFKGEKLHINEAKEREERDGRGHQKGGKDVDRETHHAKGQFRGGWGHGARGAHTNRGQGGKRGS
jgi:cold-inducible RNA-binding protein